MDLTSLKSLQACSLDEVKQGISSSKKKTELYVREIHPHEFSKLNLSPKVEVEVTMTSHVFEKSDSYFYHLFHEVLYRSLRVEVDLERIRLVKELKLLSALLLSFLTVVFVLISLTMPFKIALFILITLISIGLYALCLQKPELSVTHIERRTNFKIINETWLEQMPALYVVDQNEVYIGGNFLTGETVLDSFYKVESEAERLKLRELYRGCVEHSSMINDEILIAYYFELVQGMESSVLTSIE